MMSWKLSFLYFLFLLLSTKSYGQKTLRADNEKIIVEALKEFNNPSAIDPLKSSKIVSKLILIRNNCNDKQKQIIDVLNFEQKNREGDIEGFKKGMESLIRQNPLFASSLINHYYALNTTKYLIYNKDFINASRNNLNNILIAKKSKINRYISQAYQNRSLLFRISNNRDSSVYYATLSTKYAKRSDSREDLAFSFHNEAIIQSHFGELELAVEKELLALQLAEKYNLLYFESMFNRVISNYSIEVLNIKESYAYLRKADKLAKKLNDERSIALCRVIEGSILINNLKSIEAIPLLKNAISTLEKFEDTENMGRAYKYLGQALEKTNRTTEALEAFNKSLNYFENFGNQELSDIFLLIGQVYLKIKLFKDAKNNIEKAIAISIQQKENNKIFNAYKLLSELYSETGNKKLSYEYLKKYVSHLELNSTSKNAQKIALLTQKNSSEERERLIETQGETLEKELKENKILQLQSDRRFYGIIFSIIIFILGVFIFLIYARQGKIKQEQRVSEMSQTLLRSQMNPHFIFNAMSVIQSYIYSNTPDLASKFLVNFSRLIRLILENSNKEFIPLEIEEEILTKYLNTQKLRFENRFNFKIKIDEELRLKRVLIPPMITQPFIENAIEHGQLHKIENGMITIYISEKDNLLNIDISDNGVGRLKAGKIKKNKNHKSMAINITRERIKILNEKYNGNATLSIEDFDSVKKTGTQIIISLPIVFEITTFNHEEKTSNN